MADDNIMRVPVSDGGHALVSPEDAWALEYNWHRCQRYAVRHATVAGKEIGIRMHREILERAGVSIEGLQVDHVNGDRSDNRRRNLRPANQSQQNMNQTRKRDGCTSRFKGVYWSKIHLRWIAGIRIHGVRKHLGYFKVEEDARDAYNVAARELFGEFAAEALR